MDADRGASSVQPPGSRPSLAGWASRNFSGRVCTLLQIRQLRSRRGVNNYNKIGV